MSANAPRVTDVSSAVKSGDANVEELSGKKIKLKSEDGQILIVPVEVASMSVVSLSADSILESNCMPTELDLPYLVFR